MTPAIQLWIVNDTLQVLTKKNTSRLHMLSWDFEDIPPRTCKSFHIEFQEGWFIREKFDRGLVTFEHKSGLEFQIVADRLTDPKLTLTWRVVPNQVTCFPPAAQGQNTCAMGWTTNGTRVILVQDKDSPTDEMLAMINCFRHTRQEMMPPKGSWDWLRSLLFLKEKDLGTMPVYRRARSYTPMALGGWEKTWMEHYSKIIGSLTLGALTIPGTHGSGTYCAYSPFAQGHEKTQSLSIAQQLELGIRALDIQIGQEEEGKFIIAHDMFRTKYTVKQALTEITKFVEAYPKEIVILDINKFTVLEWVEVGFDYASLKTELADILLPFALPPDSNNTSTLNDIWAAKDTKRIVVAWDGPEPDAYMWSGIAKHTYSDVHTPEQLHQSIAEDNWPKGAQEGLWSMGVFESVDFVHTPRLNSIDTFPSIDNWFYGCGDWALKANIISLDFFDEFGNIVVSSVCANLIKGHGTLRMLKCIMESVRDYSHDNRDGWVVVSEAQAPTIS